MQTNLAAVLLGEGDPGSTAYVAKFGLHGFARALLCEVRHDSIRVVALKRAALPGPLSMRLVTSRIAGNVCSVLFLLVPNPGPASVDRRRPDPFVENATCPVASLDCHPENRMSLS